MNISLKKTNYWLLLTLFIIVIDQISKAVMSLELDLNLQLPITSFFSLTLKHNAGAAFSFLGSENGWQRYFLSAVSLLVSIALFIWMLRLKPQQHWLSCALAFILGGAISNLYDRIAYGYVIDFLHFHIGQYSWPVFNLADTAICIGVFMLIMDMFKSQKHHGTRGSL